MELGSAGKAFNIFCQAAASAVAWMSLHWGAFQQADFPHTTQWKHMTPAKCSPSLHVPAAFELADGSAAPCTVGGSHPKELYMPKQTATAFLPALKPTTPEHGLITDCKEFLSPRDKVEKVQLSTYTIRQLLLAKLQPKVRLLCRLHLRLPTIEGPELCRPVS